MLNRWQHIDAEAMLASVRSAAFERLVDGQCGSDGWLAGWIAAAGTLLTLAQAATPRQSPLTQIPATPAPLVEEVGQRVCGPLTR